MKRLLLSCITLFLLCTLALQAQNKTFPEGLRKLTNKEMMDIGPNPPKDLPAYGPDGAYWPAEKIQEMTAAQKLIPEFYADENGKPKAIKFRKLTAQEEAMFAQFEAERKRMEALIGTEAKDFEVTDMEGNTVKLSDLRGSVVAINFWFVGCKPCIMEMPELNEIVKEFDGKPVKFVAIALDKESALKKFEQKHQFDYDIVADGRAITRLYEISGYPTHCIVDQNGKIAYFKSAYSPMTATELTNTLEKLLHN